MALSVRTWIAPPDLIYRLRKAYNLKGADMTVAELIERLQEMEPELRVVQRRGEGGGRYTYRSMDGWCPQRLELVIDEHPLNAGFYFEPGHNDDRERFEALEL